MLFYTFTLQVQASFYEFFPVYIERDIVIFKAFFFAYAVQHDNCVYHLFATLCYLAYMVQSCKTRTDQCLLLF